MRNLIIKRIEEIAKEENNFTKEGWEDFKILNPKNGGDIHINEVSLYLLEDDHLIVVFERIIFRQASIIAINALKD